MHLAYPIKFASNQSLTFIGDVFNLFNRQAITQLDQRYNLVQNGACAGIPAAACNGDGGLQHSGSTINPIAQLANPVATATTSFTGQRSLRIGIKLTF